MKPTLAAKPTLFIAIFSVLTLFACWVNDAYAANAKEKNSSKSNKSTKTRVVYKSKSNTAEKKSVVYKRRGNSSYSRAAIKPIYFPIRQQKPISMSVNQYGFVTLSSLPLNFKLSGSRYVVDTQEGNRAVLTLRPDIQEYVEFLVKGAQAPHLAIVVMEPSTGRILGIGGKSVSLDDPILHANFPAASLFKVVTSATALEQTTLEPDSLISFRGGTYELERWNYLPSPGRDRRTMTLTEALGKSCNAVFGRVAGIYIKPPTLFRYASNFGFNAPLRFDVPTEVSRAVVPTDDFLLSRTGAGFGVVSISPIHAAALMSGIGNTGLMPRPQLIEEARVDGKVIRSSPQILRRMVNEQTARSLLEMMVATTVTGTSRKDFMNKKNPVLGQIEVSAKTGTLTGKYPAGVNHWFIAAAPTNNPQLAVAIVSIDPRNSSARPGRMGRLIFERFLKSS